MYKVTQQFKFSITHDVYSYDFAGQLVFKAKEINNIGTLHTEEELASFGTVLNEAIKVPEYWTLELLAKHLYDHARPVFSNLSAVTLYLVQNPERVAEFSSDSADIGNDIMELEAIA